MGARPRRKKAHQPATRDPERSRQRILQAALKEFATRGLAGARVDRIARSAGINKRMLYHYFGGKELLFSAVLKSKLVERSAWLDAAPQGPELSLPYWFEIACQDPDWIRMLEWEALQTGEEPLLENDRRERAFVAALARIRDAQSQGLISDKLDPGQLLLSMMALTAYPFAFPQLARLAAGRSISDPEFQKERVNFLKELGRLMRGVKTRTT